MNPYGVGRRPLDLVAIERWNYANKRAREEYAAYPTASCGDMGRIDGDPVPCDAMETVPGSRLCRRCARERLLAAVRMRGARRLSKEK